MMFLTKKTYTLLDVILNERGYERSTSQSTMYCPTSLYKTIEESDKPISTCLLDQMKNDANFPDKKLKILASSVAPLQRAANIALKNQVFETLKSFEPSWNRASNVQDVTTFLKKATKILQRTINIVDLKGGEKVFKFKLATNVEAEPYHLCFVQDSDNVYQRCWLSITCKKVQNTLTTQMEPALEIKPDLNKSRGFSRVFNFFRK